MEKKLGPSRVGSSSSRTRRRQVNGAEFLISNRYKIGAGAHQVTEDHSESVSGFATNDSFTIRKAG
jgi:hypothetical protein